MYVAMQAIPSASGLFAAAIPMSGASRNNVTLQEASRDNEIFLTLTHCAGTPTDHAATRKCMDGLSEDEIRTAYEKMCKLKGTMCACGAFDFHLPVPTEYQSGVAIIDGHVVPHNLQQALGSEQHTRVPTLAGSMAQEASGSPSCTDSEGGCAETFRCGSGREKMSSSCGTV